MSSGRWHTAHPFQNTLLHPYIFWFWRHVAFILSLLKYFLEHLEIEKFLPWSVILALNIGAVVCQACSSRALCCSEGTRAFGNRHWILSPSLFGSLGYRENCFPWKWGKLRERERRSGTICRGKLGGLRAQLLRTSQSPPVHGSRYTSRLCCSMNLRNRHLQSDWDALAHRAS